MISIKIPDTSFSVLNDICGKEAKVLNIEGDEVEIDCEGKKFKTKLEDVIPSHEIEKVRSIFRHGKIAWLTRQMKKVI